jgi:hypothetical protein
MGLPAAELLPAGSREEPRAGDPRENRRSMGGGTEHSGDGSPPTHRDAVRRTARSLAPNRSACDLFEGAGAKPRDFCPISNCSDPHAVAIPETGEPAMLPDPDGRLPMTSKTSKTSKTSNRTKQTSRSRRHVDTPATVTPLYPPVRGVGIDSPSPPPGARERVFAAPAAILAPENWPVAMRTHSWTVTIVSTLLLILVATLVIALARSERPAVAKEFVAPR